MRVERAEGLVHHHQLGLLREAARDLRRAAACRPRAAPETCAQYVVVPAASTSSVAYTTWRRHRRRSIDAVIGDLSWIAGATWQARHAGSTPGEQARHDREHERRDEHRHDPGARARRNWPGCWRTAHSPSTRARGRARRRRGRWCRPRPGTARRSRAATRRARAARRSRCERRRNFASSRPTVLSRHTSRKPNASHSCSRTSPGTTLLKSSHSITSRSRTLGGRSKRPLARCWSE